MFDVIIVGAGAAGYFCALKAGLENRNLKILILEKSSKVLSKVRVSGGGRCNVTNSISSITEFSKNYPRGEKFMKKLLYNFSQEDCIKWFNERGITLKTEADGRMFPESNTSETIINCFTDLANELGIKLSINEAVNQIIPQDYGFEIVTSKQTLKAKAVVLACGGSPKNESYNWLRDMHIDIEPPQPSLFTFNCKEHDFKEFMGLSCEAKVSIEGTSMSETGPLLITHWGFSGPAVLKCSAFAARDLAKMNYHFNIKISWLPELNQEEIREWLQKQRIKPGGRLIKNKVFDAIPNRLWEGLVTRAGIPIQKPWNELSKKQINVLTETLSADRWEIKGKTTFKEEFVTSGGIKLTELDAKTCMLKKHQGLYAIGELIDVDGVTGGFNFQNAWSSATAAAQGIVGHLPAKA